MTRKPTAKQVTGGFGIGQVLVVFISLACVLGFTALMMRKDIDPGIRVWILNHAPDQVIIVNPFKGVVEKKFQVADGLKDLAFSWDYSKAFIGNVVDVTNKLSVISATTALGEEKIELDGVPQGIGVFPDNQTVAIILGSSTDFMAGGFDVLDLSEQSKADPKKKKRLYRERDMRLTSKIAVGDDGDRIYCVDAVSDMLHVFSLNRKQEVGQIELLGAPEELLYPRAGDYYYVSVLQHKTIYQLDKKDDNIVGAFIYQLPDPDNKYVIGKLRHMAVNNNGHYLFGTNYEKDTVAIWEVGNPDFVEPWQLVQQLSANDETRSVFPVPYFTPKTVFKLKGGYNPNVSYTPGGQQVAVGPNDQYLFVIDEDGALYIFDLKGNNSVLRVDSMSTPEPRDIVTEVSSDVTEIRDMKVSMPPAGMSQAGKGQGQ